MRGSVGPRCKEASQDVIHHAHPLPYFTGAVNLVISGGSQPAMVKYQVKVCLCCLLLSYGSSLQQLTCLKSEENQANYGSRMRQAVHCMSMQCNI